MQKSKWPLSKIVNARECGTREPNGKPIAQITRERGIFSRESYHEERNRPAWIMRLPAKLQTLLHSMYLYSNPYSNADEKQQTLAVRSERRTEE